MTNATEGVESALASELRRRMPATKFRALSNLFYWSLPRNTTLSWSKQLMDLGLYYGCNPIMKHREKENH